MLLSIILPGALLPLRLWEGQWQTDPINLILSQSFISLLFFVCWLSIIRILNAHLIRSKWQKTVVSLCVCVILSIAFYYATNSFIEDYPLRPLREFPIHWALFRLSIRGILICLIMYPIAYYFISQKEFYKVKLELEKTKNDHLLAQLNLLQLQMDPHFIFNALSVLKSGYGDSWTKQYLVELSNVIRYQLTITDKSTTISVKKELQFTESYLAILRERFGAALQVTLQIGQLAEELAIPPYTLQTLVENAIKHNRINSEQALLIELFDERPDHQHYIVVRNTIQLKKRLPDSDSGLGLANLKKRYQLIANRNILIFQDSTHFTVKAPLLV